MKIQLQTLFSAISQQRCYRLTLHLHSIYYYLLAAATSQHPDQRTRRGVDPTFIRHSRKTTQTRAPSEAQQFDIQTLHSYRQESSRNASKQRDCTLPPFTGSLEASTNKSIGGTTQPSPQKEMNTLAFWRKFYTTFFFFFGDLATNSRKQQNLSNRQLSHGRQFGTSLRNTNSRLTTASSPFRTRYAAAAPIVLGGVSSSRSLSLWGWGGGSKKDDSAASAAATTPETASDAVAAPAPVEQASAATSAVPADAAAAASATEPAVAASDVDLSSISALINGQDILNMPEDLGYLHAIGLDYGWGFTSAMQWTLEHVHVWSGLGWGASIMATAVLLRAIMFYPQIQSLKFNAIMQRMRKDPRSNEAMKLVQQGFQESDMEKRQRGQVLNKMLRSEYGVSNWGILWSLAQIPFTFGLFRIVSGMVHIPVPSLESAGFLWFTDLSATDPYFILPAAGTALMMGALLVSFLYA